MLQFAHYRSRIKNVKGLIPGVDYAGISQDKSKKEGV